MIKVTSTLDFDYDMPPVHFVRDSSALSKIASAKGALKFERTPGQTDLHIIALGAYEGTGYNRNGDCFLEKDCISNHHLFKKANRAVHRHHKNKPESPKFGNIKVAAYNKQMKRIELIVGLDDDKCADILAEQEKKGVTQWSMASRQHYDICSFCGHKAKTDKDRCEHIPEKIGELREDGEICGMINPNPQWFEISYVGRGADRIGLSLKVAGDSRVRPMLPSDYLKLYPGLAESPSSGTEFLISKKAEDKRRLLSKLAEMEKRLDAVSKGKDKGTSVALFLKRQSRLKDSPKIDSDTMDELRKHSPSKTFKCLADRGIIFSPEEFVDYAFGDRAKPEFVEGVKTHLPGIFSKLEEGDASEVVNSEQFEPEVSSFLPPSLKKLVQSLFSGHSLFGEPSVKRVMRITISVGGSPEQEVPKEHPSENKADEKVAEVYANYKLAALNYLAEKGELEDTVLWNALIQNR